MKNRKSYYENVDCIFNASKSEAKQRKLEGKLRLTLSRSIPILLDTMPT